MTEEQKQRIEIMRRSFIGYKKIAKELGINLNAVKSYCRQHHLQESDLLKLSGLCLYCNQPLKNTPHKRPKKYCSDACRQAWWSEHQEALNHKAIYQHRCLQCGDEFENGKKKANFCSRSCYAAFRRKEPGWYVTEKSQYTEGNGCQPSERPEAQTVDKRHESPTDRSGAKFPHLPAHCQCASCPWFYNGKRHCQNDGVSAQALPSDHR